MIGAFFYTYHRSPHVVKHGDKWRKREVILSTEWGTKEFLHMTMAHSNGPWLSAYSMGNTALVSNGSQRKRSVATLTK